LLSYSGQRSSRMSARASRIIATTARRCAMRASLPVGSVAVESEANERGEHTVWLEDAIADRLAAMRGPGESYSDVILRIVGSRRGRT